MTFLDKMVDMVVDPVPSPEKIHSGIKRIAIIAWSAWIVLFVILIPILISVLFVGAPMIGRVAWADQEDTKISTRTSSAIAPVRIQLDALVSKVNDLSDLVTDQVTTSLASGICRYTSLRSKEKAYGERMRLANEIQQMKQRYKKYAGIEFDQGDC